MARKISVFIWKLYEMTNLIFTLLSLAYLSRAVDYRAVDFEIFDANENFIILDEAKAIDQYLYTVKARIIRDIENVTVSILIRYSLKINQFKFVTFLYFNR